MPFKFPFQIYLSNLQSASATHLCVPPIILPCHAARRPKQKKQSTTRKSPGAEQSPSPEDEGSPAKTPPKKKKRSATKQATGPSNHTSKKRKAPDTDEPPSDEEKGRSSPDQLSHPQVPGTLKEITKRPKKTGPRGKAPPVTMGKDAKATDLTPVQAGAHAFIAEHVRNLTHVTWPQEPPVQAFIYPGRGINDACRALHHVQSLYISACCLPRSCHHVYLCTIRLRSYSVPSLNAANVSAGGKNVVFFGPVVSLRLSFLVFVSS